MRSSEAVCAIGRTAEFIQNCLIFLLHLKNLALLLHNLLLQLCRKRFPQTKQHAPAGESSSRGGVS